MSTPSKTRSRTVFWFRPSPCPCRSSFPREGITYDDLPEEEKDEWDAIEWDDEGTMPDRIEPAVVNLVFLKLVRSKTKFWQMAGRGTRLSPDLFGSGRDKTSFYILDYCQNLEFFSHDVVTTDGALVESLGKRLFKTRLEGALPPQGGLIGAVDQPPESNPFLYEDVAEVRGDAARALREEVAAMNVDNFIVRPKRQLVERYAQPEAWDSLNKDALVELATDVAGLPSEQDPEDEEANLLGLVVPGTFEQFRCTGSS